MLTRFTLHILMNPFLVLLIFNSDFEIEAPDRKTIFGNQRDSAIRFVPKCIDGVCELQSQSLKISEESQGEHLKGVILDFVQID